MQRICPKCNTLVTGEGSFCPSCGAPLPAAVDLDKQPASQSVQFTAPAQDPHRAEMPNYGTQTSTTYANSQSYNSAPAPVSGQEMTLGQWVGTVICCTWFGIISLILSIVWAVSADTPIAKKRYCQAMIIIQCISIALVIVFYIVFFAILGAAGNSFSDFLSEMT